MHMVNKHKNNETMRITPSSGVAVYPLPEMVTPPVTINQRKATSTVIIN